MTESFEAIRDDTSLVPPSLREQWIKSDQAVRMLRHTYERLEQDTDLTQEAKSRQAQEAYESNRPRIEERRKSTREALLKEAARLEQSSIPRPIGESLSSNDASRLLLDQNEAGRIVRTVERRKAQGGPFRHDSGDFLRKEYERGLETGGLEGGAVCRGVLRAAQELGISNEEIVSPLREERHHQSLDNARRLLVVADSISTRAPEIPRSLSGKGKPNGRAGTHRAVAPFLAPKGSPIVAGGDANSSGGTPSKDDTSIAAVANKKKKPRKKSFK